MPQNATEWLEVADERGGDARLLNSNGRGLAAVYMIGYAVECNLKGYLARRGWPFPVSGREGHDLRALWERSGFKLTDLHGYLRLFAERWGPYLRYEKRLPPDADQVALYKGAIALIGYIRTRSRRVGRCGHGPRQRP